MALIATAALTMGCRSSTPEHAQPVEGAGAVVAEVPVAPVPIEAAVRDLPLAGDVLDSGTEISGMAWWGDRLVLVPERLGLEEDPNEVNIAGPQYVFVLERAAIEAVVLNGDPGPLNPRKVSVTPDITSIAGLDGFEGLAVGPDGTGYFLVETHTNKAGDNPSYVVRASWGSDDIIALDLANKVTLPRPSTHSNMAHEAGFVWDGIFHALYELNSPLFVPNPAAARFDAELKPIADIPFPELLYRLTDVTAPSADGRFWGLNFRFPGSKTKGPAACECPLFKKFGIGRTHATEEHVERILEFQVTDEGVELVDRAPVLLKLDHDWRDKGARNWEGIVRFGDGVLAVTDKYPKPHTRLGFIRLPSP